MTSAAITPPYDIEDIQSDIHELFEKKGIVVVPSLLSNSSIANIISLWR
ncbi:hypothetical protein Krac_7160 [Ktedonobacter racemifer DSM 44963]|uniref:Uncharacterized protein n=1 Tax=Ktedonobacter racemifer DSM 44963 TaxID=485913 RepID=D6TR32_KTERA|nr:hypothetical protein Krac_7160 [Ktedonobacter racemifer DSM 44963]